ncbi:hypothetical protein VC83_00126 [Pseudogymnoascus destructans]|uniref:chitinase n=2 Tax=Pseudogymnoascus destructans TaxID=655981 RepID=L8GEZ7_PSED2|nr:uncharacterized protein VC83_00126 [Pseudogymnoascus destructans]ELR10751.1 hypothetical protein GMDG_05006 [Pseudogymnoascus destructans 20631-21]OAF63062.1 hypothetical protein VC83_00126 [Pseudogymnoascus destructans]
MGISKTFAAVAALSAVASATGSSARSAVATYWGQSGGSLRSYCDTADTDYIPLGFINYFPEQGNGWPGSNYASSCWASTYTAPGYNGVDNLLHNRLFNHCPGIAQDIQYCQSKGKKMLLSLGGGPNTYSLTGKEDGESFADFLWAAYGPSTDEWTGPRPFDPLPGTEGEGIATVVDGFDFDIEHPDTDKSAGYIAMINRLRNYFPEGSNYLITGAPQCVVNDANMDLMIQGAKFDIIWVQFYNTDGCAARDWVKLNPNYEKTGVETTVPKDYPFGGFSYDAWLKRLQAPGSKSKNAKLSIGVLGTSNTDRTVSIDYYLSSAQLKPLIDEYYCHDNFGGFMIWDAVSAGNNKDANGVTYQAQIKNLLLAREAKGCAKPTSTVSSTTAKSTSTSSTKAPVTTSTDEPITTGPLTTGPSTTAVPTSTGHWGNNTISDSPTLTSTILRTTVYTVTSCAPTVTNCPLGHLTTATLTDYTTWCPGNPTITSAPTTTGAAKPTKSGKASTVYTTIIHTITACPPSVTNCPANEKTTSVATETKALYTTICDEETTLQTAPVATGGIKAVGTGSAVIPQAPFVGSTGRVGGSVFAAAVVGVLALLM